MSEGVAGGGFGQAGGADGVFGGVLQFEFDKVVATFLAVTRVERCVTSGARQPYKKTQELYKWDRSDLAAAGD